MQFDTRVFIVTAIALLLCLSMKAAADESAPLFAQPSSELVNGSDAGGFGDSLPQCVELVKQCFVRSDSERSNCFFTAAKHPFCEGSELSKLAFARWSSSPDLPPGYSNAPALTGPLLVDRDCLGKFDAQFSARLVQGDLTSQAIDDLNVVLRTCRREVMNELVRP